MKRFLLVAFLFLAACGSPLEPVVTVTPTVEMPQEIPTQEPSPTPEAICVPDFISRMKVGQVASMDLDASISANFDCSWFAIGWADGTLITGGMSRDGLHTISCYFKSPSEEFAWNCELTIGRDPATAPVLNMVGWVYPDGKAHRICLAETTAAMPAFCE